MVKKLALTVAAAAFVFGGASALQPDTAHASGWSKAKAEKSWSKTSHWADKKARKADMVAGWVARKAEKKAGWMAHWGAKKARKGK